MHIYLIIAIMLLLASCSTSARTPGQLAGSPTAPAPASPAVYTPPLNAPRQAPVTGSVEGISKEQLQAGVEATLSVEAGRLQVAVSRDATVRALTGDGAPRSATPDAPLALDVPAAAGAADYYELARADGSGNKTAMGVVNLPEGALPCPIVFIREARRAVSADAATGKRRLPFMVFRNLGYTSYNDQAIMRLDPDGTLSQILALGDRPIQDLEPSVDGSTILFSMMEFAGSDMEIFEMGADGTNLTQLTFNDYQDGEPGYLPDGRIMFTSERLGIADFYDAQSQVPQLFVLDRLTGEEQLLHLASDGVFNPIVAHNGEIYFTSWDFRFNFSGPHFNRFVIWRMRADGTDPFPLFGSHICRDNVDVYCDVRETFDRQLLLTHTNFDIPGIGRAHHENYGAGSILQVDPQGNPDFPTYRYLAPREIVDSAYENTRGRFKFPVPLPDGRVLATYAPGKVWEDEDHEEPNFGIYELTGTETPVALCDSEEFWEYGAVALAPRQAPPVYEDSTAGQPQYGDFFCENIFDRGGDMRQDHPRADQGPWKLRVIQAFKQFGFPTAALQPGDLTHKFPLLGNGKMLGEYPVAPDGSVRFRVPADVPVTWELVDGSGRVAVRERMFNTVRPGEVQTCKGCHGRTDKKHNINQGALAFDTEGDYFYDLTEDFDDFFTTVIDRRLPGDI
jgi:hypothetical protein